MTNVNERIVQQNMTEGEALAAAAMRQGEANAAAWADHAEQMQSSISGSGVDTSDAGLGPEDGAAGWWGTGSTAEVSPQPKRSPNVIDPLDNSQAYGPDQRVP
jgi:hypothetical protein